MSWRTTSICWTIVRQIPKTFRKNLRVLFLREGFYRIMKLTIERLLSAETIIMGVSERKRK